MLNKNDVIKLMSDRGFTVYFSSADGTYLDFVPKSMYDSYSSDIIFNVFVYLNTGDFKMVYHCPCSTNDLSLSDCGPITNDSLFNRVLNTFVKQAEMIRSNYPGER